MSHLNTLNLGCRLWNQLNLSGTTCISPLSIHLALAMVYLGADGNTKLQIAKALDFGTDKELADTIDWTLRMLTSTISTESQTKLQIANRLFGRDTFSFKKAFLQRTKKIFDAELQPMDFTKPAATADIINQWVEEKTNQKIRDLISPNSITSATTLILVNALYMKAAWAKQFKKEKTKPEAFTSLDGTRKLVPTMNTVGAYGYESNNKGVFICLPLSEGFAFNVFMPASSELDNTGLEVPELATAHISLHLPKFKIDSGSIKVGQALQALGITEAFDLPHGSANFEHIAPRKPDDYLYLGDVVHKTFIDLNEDGIEAAAATAGMMVRCCSMYTEPEPIEVRIDRPFFFTITHPTTNTCMFLGAVTEL